MPDWLVSEQRWLSLREIFSHGVGFCLSSSCYETGNVTLVENTSDEIRDLAMEMSARLKGTWRAQPEDDALQSRFWEIFPLDATDVNANRPLHGEIRARRGAHFLRHNPGFLE